MCIRDRSIAELQEILADNLGVKTAINVSGEINVNVAFTTLTSVGSNVSKTVSQDLTLSITPMPEHFTEDDAPILLSMYPGLEELIGDPPLPTKASVNFDILDAKDGNSEIISVNHIYNLNDGQIFLGDRKVADISYSKELVGARVDFVEDTLFEDIVDLLKNLTYVNQGEATEGTRSVQASLVNEFEEVRWQAVTDVFVPVSYKHLTLPTKA